MLNYEIQQMYFIPPSLLSISNNSLLLTQESRPIRIEMWDFSKPIVRFLVYTPYSSSSLESLLSARARSILFVQYSPPNPTVGENIIATIKIAK